MLCWNLSRLLLKALRGCHLNPGFCCSSVFGWQYPPLILWVGGRLLCCGNEKSLRFEGWFCYRYHLAVRWKTLPIDRGFPACWWWGCHFYHYRQMKLVQNLCTVWGHFNKIFSTHFCPSRSPSLPCSSCPSVIGFVLSSYSYIVFCISPELCNLQSEYLMLFY